MGVANFFGTCLLIHSQQEIICAGSVLWDIIGSADHLLSSKSDSPGRIERRPGGVSFNIGKQLAKNGMRPVMLTVISEDLEGKRLLAECEKFGLNMKFVTYSKTLPTDKYLAIEDESGLFAAVADARSLELEGEKILRPLLDGRLGSIKRPFQKILVLDGNFTKTQLQNISKTPALMQCQLKIAPASPGKVERLRCFADRPHTTIFCNLTEARILCKIEFRNTEEASQSLVQMGFYRAVVTDGGNMAADSGAERPTVAAIPKAVKLECVTGAGDVFMAAHIFAEFTGSTPQDALNNAITIAGAYVSSAEA